VAKWHGDRHSPDSFLFLIPCVDPFPFALGRSIVTSYTTTSSMEMDLRGA